MKQPRTEQSIEHTDDQQNTGNHKKPGFPDAGGADRLGGTRAGAENVETGGGSDRGKQSGGAVHGSDQSSVNASEGQVGDAGETEGTESRTGGSDSRT